MGEIRGLIIAVLLFSGVLLGLASFSGDLFNQYGISSDDLSYINQTSEITRQVKEIQEQTNQTITISNPLDFFVVGVYNSLNLLFNIGSTLQAIVNDVTFMMGKIIPAWFNNIVIAIISVVILFAIINAIIAKKEV